MATCGQGRVPLQGTHAGGRSRSGENRVTVVDFGVGGLARGIRPAERERLRQGGRAVSGGVRWWREATLNPWKIFDARTDNGCGTRPRNSCRAVSVGGVTLAEWLGVAAYRSLSISRLRLIFVRSYCPAVRLAPRVSRGAERPVSEGGRPCRVASSRRPVRFLPPPRTAPDAHTVAALSIVSIETRRPTCFLKHPSCRIC